MKNNKGDFVEHVIADRAKDDGAGFVCPETGKDLAGYGLKKYAATLWPSLNPRALPNSEAGRRYQSLLDESAKRADVADE